MISQIKIKMSIHDQHISQTKYYFDRLLREHKPWELFSTIYNHQRHKVEFPFSFYYSGPRPACNSRLLKTPVYQLLSFYVCIILLDDIVLVIQHLQRLLEAQGTNFLSNQPISLIAQGGQIDRISKRTFLLIQPTHWSPLFCRFSRVNLLHFKSIIGLTLTRCLRF